MLEQPPDIAHYSKASVLRFPSLFLSTCRLKIMDAKLSDSGNYTCMPTSAEASSVMVHVINGEFGDTSLDVVF